MSTALEWVASASLVVVGMLAGLFRYSRALRIRGKGLNLNVSLSLGKASKNKDCPTVSARREHNSNDSSSEFEGKFWRENFRIRKKHLRKYAEACSFSPP